MKKDKDVSLSIDIGSVIHCICGAYGLLKVSKDTFQDIWGDIICSGDTSEELLFNTINEVEQKIKKLLEEKPLYDMIYFSRRIFPDNFFECSNSEIFIYRNMMTLSFQKYCKHELSHSLCDGEESLLPNYLVNMNLLEFYDRNNNLKPLVDLRMNYKIAVLCSADRINTCYKIEKYCFYLNHLIRTYRTICKGALLSYSDKLGFVAVTDKILNKRLSLHDNRNILSNILSPIAGYADLHIKSKITEDKLPYVITIYQENLEKVDTKKFLHKQGKNLLSLEEKFISNYLPIPIDISTYYKYCLNFNEEFHNYYGFAIEDFLVFLNSIFRANMQTMYEDNRMILQMFQRGYAAYKYHILRSNYIDNYEQLAQELGIQKQPIHKKEETFSRIFKLLSLRRKDIDSINLKTLGPRKIFYRFDSSYGLIDYTQWLTILEQILRPICKDNDEKGNAFEKIVIKEVAEKFGNNSFWINQKELKANNKKREIDVSFIYNDILIILECKAVNMSISSYVGDRKAVEFRENKNKKNIEQADKTINFIVENIGRLNHKMPDNLKGILSLVITPSVEYIWDLGDKNLMINDSLPRIISLMELEQLKNDQLYQDIQDKPFFVKM